MSLRPDTGLQPGDQPAFNNLRAVLLDTQGPEIRMGGLAVCQSATGTVPS